MACRGSSVARRGMVTWILLTVTVVLGVLMFAFNLIVRQRNVQAHALYYGQVAHGLAESAIALAWNELRNRTADRADDLHAFFVEAEAPDLVGVDVDLELDPVLMQELTQDLPDAAVTVTVRVVEAETLVAPDDLESGYDPIEKSCLVEVASEGSFQGIERTLTQTRRVRVQLSNLPVLSRFSLFIREPEVEDSTDPGYNLFANDINGRMDAVTLAPGQNYLPLVLYNHGDTFPRTTHDLEENGYVFMGGDDPVKLNLTSGGDYNFGQYFHFYNFIDSRDAKQAAFINSSPPPFFANTYDVDGLTHQYFLKHVIYGYFTVDASSPPRDMNKNGLLEPYFAAGTTMRSGIMHLFGTTICPSPARVFGLVYQSYPMYSGITVDVNGDGQRDGLVNLLPAITDTEFDLLPSIAPIPSSIRDLSNPGGTIILDPFLLEYDQVFGDFTTYEQYMSLVVEAEPYNTSLDYMLARGEFPPQTRILDPDEDYPNTGEVVRIQRRDDPADTGIHYLGNLNEVTDDILDRRVVAAVRDRAEFEALFIRNTNELHLGLDVRIENGNLTLPDRLVVKKGGMILCDGSIEFDGVTCDPDERLSLVSKNGNIYSPFEHATELAPAQVDLVALGGRVGSSDPGHRIAVKGTIAANRVDPDDMKSGGMVVYPAPADPSGPGRIDLARVLVSDLTLEWAP